MGIEPAVILKPGKEKALRNRHPWVFSGAVAEWPADAEPGAIVRVLGYDGRFLARGYLNRRSQICTRILSFHPDERIDRGFWQRRLSAAAITRRGILADGGTDACRLVYAEGDGLPGLVVDRYGDWLAVQVLTLGMEKRKAEIIEILVQLFKPAGIWERSDVDVRQKEGLEPTSGPAWGDPPPERVLIRENGMRFSVDLREGHKTGFYLDQRENRRRAVEWFQRSGGAEALNAFSYTGAFGVCALKAGFRHVTQVDSSAAALESAAENTRINGFDPAAAVTWVTGDVFQVLRRFRSAGRRFDAVVLDPPKLAFNKTQIPAAARGYKDLNLLAMQLINPGGLLLTFSCSGLVSPDLFQKILFGASLDANREVQIVEWLSQGSDHPVLLSFPEGHYLKGLVCRVQ